MIPKDTECRYCGRRIIFIQTAKGRIPVEAWMTPYRRREGAKNLLYTVQGGMISCEILPEDMVDEAEGFAHRYHYCPARPGRERQPSQRELRREEYREFRERQKEDETA